MTSLRSFFALRVHSPTSKADEGVVVNEVDRFRDLERGVDGSRTANPISSTRESAISSDIDPLSSSTMSTADAAEYFSDGATETRE